MSVYGDYAASIIHSQRSQDLQAEVRKDSIARGAKGKGRPGSARKARSAAGARARTV